MRVGYCKVLVDLRGHTRLHGVGLDASPRRIDSAKDSSSSTIPLFWLGNACDGPHFCQILPSRSHYPSNAMNPKAENQSRFCLHKFSIIQPAKSGFRNTDGVTRSYRKRVPRGPHLASVPGFRVRLLYPVATLSAIRL